MGYKLVVWNVIWLVLFLVNLRTCCMGNGELNGTNSTSICGLSVPCGDLNISYPFSTSGSCAASPAFVLSNCSSSSVHAAHWNSLSVTLQAANPGDPPPVAIIEDIINTASEGNDGQSPDAFINLTWNTSLLSMDFCASLFTSHNLSQFNIPASFNLTGFEDDEFQFSAQNIYLFFNCTDVAAVSQYVNSTASKYYSSGQAITYNIWQQESKYCDNHKQICQSELAGASCVSLLAPYKELTLRHAMDTLACSHFTFGIDDTGIMEKGLVQLSWTDSKCSSCTKAGGSCVYDINQSPSIGKMSYCGCNDGRIDPGAQTCQLDLDLDSACYGGLMQCNHVFQICLGFVLLMVALMLGFLGFYYFGKIRKSFHDLASRLACLAIYVLKKVLRRLQESTYRPNLSLILRELEGLTERPIEYSYSSIASATKSFSCVVGEGGFGVVYKGTLPSNNNKSEEAIGVEIAVKVLEIRSKHMKKQFLNEVGTIGRIHHVNVVRLLGFCVQEDHEMLVYEYVANGSLDKWLFTGKNGGDDEERMLDWSQRYAIALGVARGLSYLHEECRHRTVHCDIKPQNILLDEAMSPKIADFGLSRLMSRDESQVVTLARGTPGYMAPEFWRGGESRLSTKFDVYSYGMVLLELISGRHNFTLRDASTDSMWCFPAVAFEAAMEGNMAAMLDPRLGISVLQTSIAEEEDGAQGHQIWTAAFVAMWCIQDHPASRPSMSEVVQYLEGTIAISKAPPKPSISTTPPLTSFAVTSHDRQEFTPISVGR
ncbi:hypothetical protein GOP47_0009097 [Adiantum capillus-veneris]|uniref:Protein kinase domain-containing protein n=1 Tax=Adiantum capillus-veneris TaxID=13818 RepID=A0A9D4ZKC2_ADICA|nr:hypothetical protein GOP47_0009097 [Adiantum capillus-veneris]